MHSRIFLAGILGLVLLADRAQAQTPVPLEKTIELKIPEGKLAELVIAGKTGDRFRFQVQGLDASVKTWLIVMKPNGKNILERSGPAKAKLDWTMSKECLSDSVLVQLRAREAATVQVLVTRAN